MDIVSREISTLARLRRWLKGPGATVTILSDRWPNGTDRTNRWLGIPRRVTLVTARGVTFHDGTFMALATPSAWTFLPQVRQADFRVEPSSRSPIIRYAFTLTFDKDQLQ
jgi:hypothetical protein